MNSFLCEDDFPSIKNLHADYQKGIESLEFQKELLDSNISFQRCFRHMIDNLNDACKNYRAPSVGNSGTIYDFCWDLAKVRTQSRFEKILSEIRKEHGFAATWLDGKLFIFVELYFNFSHFLV